MVVTKTINPLHFEDLDPHRFEDLIRQLIYDFKHWKSLEALGRSGNEDGFDIRGWESITSEDNELVESEEESHDEKIIEAKESILIAEDRIWLVQCKREKSITPSKIKRYAEEIVKNSGDNLYGVIFVAPCNLSKNTRDTFREKLKQHGVQEVHLWSNGELEDMLFQPKNDHLLFAYFGISLTIRKRSLKNQIRSKLSIKRKVSKFIGKTDYKMVLIRDANDKNYPFKKEVKDYEKNPPWRSYFCLGRYYDGVKILVRKRYAYLHDDGKKWDVIEQYDDAKPEYHRFFGGKPEIEFDDYPLRYAWGELADSNRGWYEVIGYIPYEKIIDIDSIGDEITPHDELHIYVDGCGEKGFFAGIKVVIKTITEPKRELHSPSNSNKINHFPEKFPDPRK